MAQPMCCPLPKQTKRTVLLFSLKANRSFPQIVVMVVSGTKVWKLPGQEERAWLPEKAKKAMWDTDRSGSKRKQTKRKKQCTFTEIHQMERAMVRLGGNPALNLSAGTNFMDFFILMSTSTAMQPPNRLCPGSPFSRSDYG